MDFLGIGPLELLMVLLLVILVFGPEDLAKAGKTIGRTLNKIVRSDGWRAVRDINKEMRDIPNRLVKEAELEETIKEVKELSNVPKELESDLRDLDEHSSSDEKPSGKDLEAGIKAWTTLPEASPEPTESPKNSEN